MKLPRGKDPLKITLQECEALISEVASKPAGPVIIADYGDIKIVDGRYGPYIKAGDSNYRIPKGKEAAALSENECKTIIANSEPTGKNSRNRRK